MKDKTKTASEEVKETFGEIYDKIQDYCSWVLENCFVLDLLEDKQERTDIIEGLPVMDLEMSL